MRNRVVIVALVLATAGPATACSGLRSNDEAVEFPSRAERQGPPYARDVRVGETYDGYVLYTHCGITHAEIDGGFWRADPPLVQNAGPPEGWNNPLTEGTLTIESEKRAKFESDGQIAYFERADIQPPPCD